VSKVSVDLLTKRELLRGNATERKEVAQVSVSEQLKQLALEFAKWQNPQKQQTIDVEMVEVLERDIEDAIHEERKRDYKKELEWEHSKKPNRVKDRAERNSARSRMEKAGQVTKGDGKQGRP